MTKRGFLADSAIAFVLAVATGCGTATAALKSDGDRRAACVANAGDATALASGHAIPFFPSASDARGRQGFARVLNHSAEAGEVTIAAFDDDGACHGPLTLTLGANETAHFNSDDLENGNAAKGLGSGTGRGQGDWRLELASGLDVDLRLPSRAARVRRRLRRLSARRRGTLRVDVRLSPVAFRARVTLGPLHLRSQPQRRSLHVSEGRDRRARSGGALRGDRKRRSPPIRGRGASVSAVRRAKVSRSRPACPKSNRSRFSRAPTFA